MFRKFTAGLASGLMSLVAIASAAEGSRGEAGGLEEVIVTAQKVEQTAQKVSRAIDVVTSEDVVKIGATNLQQILETVPNYGFAGFQGQPAMRGIGNDLVDLSSNLQPVVVVNMDGAGLSGGGRGVLDSGLTSSTFDVERVEVVRGPSGTTQGQNALGGAINVITRAPQLGVFDFNFTGQVGNYNARQLSGGINIPIGDSLALRVAAQTQKHDSYSTTTCMADLTGFPPGFAPICSQGQKIQTWGFEDQKAVRAKLLWKAGDHFKATLAMQYSQDNATDRGLTIVGSPDWSDPWNFELTGVGPTGSWVPFLVTPSRTTGPKVNRYSAELEWNLGRFTLVDLPAYTTSKPTACPPGPPCSLETDTRTSNELRIQSAPGAKYQWQAGVYLDRYDLRSQGCGTSGGTCTSVGADATLNINQAWILSDAIARGVSNPILINASNSAGGRDTKSIYASMVIPFTDTTRLRAGLRYARDNTESDPLGYFVGRALPAGGLAAATFSTPAGPPGSPPPDLVNVDFATAATYLQTHSGTVNCSNCTAAFTQGPYAFSGSSSPFNWNLMGEWDKTPTTMLYAGLTTGYTAGGVQTNKVPSQTYPPESVIQASIGEKARFRDNTVQWNTEAYYYKFKDYHVQVNNNEGQSVAVGGTTYTNVDFRPYLDGTYTGAPDAGLVGAESPNAIGLRTEYAVVPNMVFKGIESTMTALVTPDNKVTVNVNLADHAFGDLVAADGHDYTGEQVANSPKVSGYLRYEHTAHVFGGKLQPQISVRYTGGTPVANERYANGIRLPFQFQDAYWKVDANIAWESGNGHWLGNLFINNVKNSAQRRGAPPLANAPWFIPFLSGGTIGPPRTVGLTVSYKYH